MHRRGPSRETFFQAGRPLPTAGASPPSVLPHLETQSVFAAGPVLPTGTDLPERVELAQHPSRTGYEVLEYQRCPPRPWRERRGRRRMNQAARQDEERREETRRGEKRRGETRRDEAKRGEEGREARREVGSAVTETPGGGSRTRSGGRRQRRGEEVERGEEEKVEARALPLPSPRPPHSRWQRGGGGGRKGGRWRTAAESKRRARAESALGPSFRCRRQWQSQFLVASACRRRRGAPSV